VSRLFIGFYLDEDVSVLVARLLRSRGFVAVTARESVNLTLDDTGQLREATARGLALLTHNRRDFEQLARDYAAAGQNHCGIVIAVRRPPQLIVRNLLTVANDLSADEMDNRVMYL
jgi:hypothetical protein